MFGTVKGYDLRSGFAVSNRNFKKATDRNRVKRLMREAYRLQKNILQSRLKEGNTSLSIFFVYTAKELPDFTDIKEKMSLILQRLIKIVNENIS